MFFISQVLIFITAQTETYGTYTCYVYTQISNIRKNLLGFTWNIEKVLKTLLSLLSLLHLLIDTGIK